MSLGASTQVLQPAQVVGGADPLAVVDHFDGELLGAGRSSGDAEALMESVGMRREIHEVRASLHRSGQWRDTISYAMLAEEWPGS